MSAEAAPCTFRIREAAVGDRPALVRFMAALQDFERGMEENRLPGEDCADAHLAALEEWAGAHPGGGVLVAEGPEGPLGFIVFGVESEFGSYVLPENQTLGRLSDLWVVPEARGLGIARALIAAAEERFRAAGLKRAELTALPQNGRAISLYRALGYAECAVTFAKPL